jgi:hypothetical protein
MPVFHFRDHKNLANSFIVLKDKKQPLFHPFMAISFFLLNR